MLVNGVNSENLPIPEAHKEFRRNTGNIGVNYGETHKILSDLEEVDEEIDYTIGNELPPGSVGT